MFPWILMIGSTLSLLLIHREAIKRVIYWAARNKQTIPTKPTILEHLVPTQRRPALIEATRRVDLTAKDSTFRGFESLTRGEYVRENLDRVIMDTREKKGDRICFGKH